MRDVNRIDKFCSELAEVWKQPECCDWRFGQFLSNVLGSMQASGRDIFFPEEDEMMKFIKDYFNKDK